MARSGVEEAGKETRVAGRKPLPGIADVLAGERKDFVSELKPYLPQELVGGTIPHIPGTEDEAVWNAASQACATEKVHYCYSIEDKKIYFLACPSSVLASNPDSWCPLASALPGNSEHWDKETVYLCEQEGLASALRWDPETGRMQVFLGASRTILPRVQSMDANFVTINAQIADIVPWRNRTLRTEKLSRATAKMLVFVGMLVNAALAGVFVYNYASINLMERQLDVVTKATEKAATDLMTNAHNALQSDTIEHMVQIQRILDRLSEKDGTLVRYEVPKGKKKAEWEALLPDSFAEQFGDPVERHEDGRVRIKGDSRKIR